MQKWTRNGAAGTGPAGGAAPAAGTVPAAGAGSAGGTAGAGLVSAAAGAGPMAAAAPASMLDEPALLARCLQGDRSAFDPIVLHYMHRATAFALGWTGNQEDALDLSQEAFARAFRSIRSFDVTRPFFPWYHRILKNLCLNHVTRRAHRHEVPLVDDLDLRDPAVSPQQHAEREEVRRQVWEALRRLDHDHREILILREFQQLTYAELAAVLGIPRGTVMSRLHEARRRLRLQLQPSITSEESRGYSDA